MCPTSVRHPEVVVMVPVRSMHRPGTPAAPVGSPWVRTGWVVLALLPVAIVAAMVLGEWLLAAQGHDSGETDLPLGVTLRAGLPALMLLVLPPSVAAWCGQRARQRGDSRGTALVAVGLLLVIGLVVLNLAPLLVSALL